MFPGEVPEEDLMNSLKSAPASNPKRIFLSHSEGKELLRIMEEDHRLGDDDLLLCSESCKPAGPDRPAVDFARQMIAFLVALARKNRLRGDVVMKIDLDYRPKPRGKSISFEICAMRRGDDNYPFYKGPVRGRQVLALQPKEGFGPMFTRACEVWE